MRHWSGMFECGVRTVEDGHGKPALQSDPVCLDAAKRAVVLVHRWTHFFVAISRSFDLQRGPGVGPKTLSAP